MDSHIDSPLNTREGISTTALAVAMMRSIHSRLAPEPLLNDKWADTFLSPLIQSNLDDLYASGQEPPDSNEDFFRHNPGYSGILLRTRFTEDRLIAALQEGIRQYVIVGAGFDAFAWRFPEVMQQIQLFEVDLPVIQAYKRDQLKSKGIAVPGNLTFVETDFKRQSLPEALQQAQMDVAQPAYFSWLGVTMYLPLSVNLAMFDAFCECAKGGGYLAFSYIDQALFDKRARKTGKLQDYQKVKNMASKVGEPWVCGFEPQTLAETLSQHGLTLLEDYCGSDLLDQYGNGGDTCVVGNPYTRMALARIHRSV